MYTRTNEVLERINDNNFVWICFAILANVRYSHDIETDVCFFQKHTYLITLNIIKSHYLKQQRKNLKLQKNRPFQNLFLYYSMYFTKVTL